MRQTFYYELIKKVPAESIARFEQWYRLANLTLDLKTFKELPFAFQLGVFQFYLYGKITYLTETRLPVVKEELISDLSFFY